MTVHLGFWKKKKKKKKKNKKNELHLNPILRDSVQVDLAEVI